MASILTLPPSFSKRISEPVAPPMAALRERAEDSDDNKDNFSLASLSIAATLSAIWSYFSNIRSGLTEAKWFADKIRRVKLPEAEIIDGVMRVSESFSDGVIRLKNGWQDMTPQTALEAGLKWTYENFPALDITAGDFAKLMAEYGFTGEQIGNIAYVVNQRTREARWPLVDEYSLNRVWEMITNAVVENIRADHPLEQSTVTTTQRLLRERVEELESIDKEVTKGLFERLARAVATSELPPEGFVMLRLGDEEIKISRAETSLADIHSVLDKLIRNEPLAEADLEFVQELKDNNPVIERIYAIATAPIKESASGKELLLKLIKLSRSGEPTGKGISLFLEAVTGKKGPVLLMVSNGEGKRLFPRMIVRGISNGERWAEYERPYYAGTSSYHASEAYLVKGETLTKIDAVMITDARGKPFFITSNDMAHFNKLAEIVRAAEPTHKSEIGRAYLRFFNTVQAIYLSANPDYKLGAGTPEDVPERASWLRASNWANALDTEINLLREGYFNVSARVLGREISPENGRSEAIESRLHAGITSSIGKFIKKFGRTKQGEFRKLMGQLEKAILQGNLELLQKTHGELRRLAVEQAGGHKKWVAWIMLQDVAGDARTFRRVSPNSFSDHMKGTKDAPTEIRNAVSVWTHDPDYKPSLEAARRFAEEGSGRAFSEYDLLIRSESVNIDTTIIALAELADLAYSYYQIPRAGRALDMIDHMLLSGYRLPKDARRVLGDLIFAADEDPLLRMDIPDNLKREVTNGKAKAVPISDSMVKRLSRRLEKRLRSLPAEVKERLNREVNDFSRETTYAKDFLAKLALCLDHKEFWRFVRSMHSGVLTKFESLAEFEVLTPFYKRASAAVEPFTRFERLPRTAKSRLKPLLEVWKEKGYDANLLTALSVARAVEAEDIVRAFGADIEVLEFHRKAGDMIGEEVLEKLHKPATQAQVQVEARAVTPADVESLARVAESGNSVREMDTHKSRNGATIRDIGIGAVWGAATFLGSEYVINKIFGEPSTPVMAQLQGYGTMGTAMAFDHGVRALIKRNPAMRPPFSLGNFASDLGIFTVLYRATAGISDVAGIDELLGEKIGPFHTNEVVGLLGSGVAYGAAHPLLAKLPPKILQSAGYSFAGKAVKAGGAALFVVDTASNLGEAIISGYDSAEESFAVNECAQDVSLPGVSFFLPSYYNLVCRAYGGEDLSNYAEIVQRKRIYADDDALMRSAAAEFAGYFEYELKKTVVQGEEINLEHLIERAYQPVWGKFQEWEAFENNYIKGDKNWLVSIGAVKDGRLKETGAIAFWLEPYLLEILTDLDDSVSGAASLMTAMGVETSEQDKARAVIKGYMGELENISFKYRQIQNGGFWPSRL